MSDKQILIIEDEVIHAKKLKKQLLNLGYNNITICRNAQETLSVIKDKNFDLALVDIGLENSNLNGIGLAKKIKEMQRIPIIFVTSFSDESSIKNTSVVGASNYLVKPISDRQLFVSINNAFSDIFVSNPVINNTSGCPFKVEKEMMYVGDGDYQKRISISDFNFAKSDSNYVHIHTDIGKFIVSLTLKGFIEQFTNSNIVRVHRSYAVNKTKVVQRNADVLVLLNYQDNPIPIGKVYRNLVNLHFQSLKSNKS